MMLFVAFESHGIPVCKLSHPFKLYYFVMIKLARLNKATQPQL